MAKSQAAQIARARALFKSFHGRAPTSSEVVAIPTPQGGVIALEVGRLVGLAYRAAGSGEKFYHEFKSASPAKVFVTPDGQQMYTVGGRYRFTRRGFISG
jgi:hypothetical protein